MNDGSTHHGGGAGISSPPPTLGVQHHGGDARAGLGQAPHPPPSAVSMTADGPGRQTARCGNSSLKARATRARIHDRSIIRRAPLTRSKCCGRRMIQAGIYDRRAVAYFFPRPHHARSRIAILMFLVRAGGARRCGVSGCGSGSAGIIGYIGPSLYIDKRIKTRKAEHQSGFPDFMDLSGGLRRCRAEHGGVASIASAGN